MHSRPLLGQLSFGLLTPGLLLSYAGTLTRELGPLFALGGSFPV